MAKKEEEFLKNPKVQQILNVKKQIHLNIEQLNNALASNDSLFLQLAALAKNKSNTQTSNTQYAKNLPSTAVDSMKAINLTQLDLDDNLKVELFGSNYKEEEEEESEEDEVDD